MSSAQRMVWSSSLNFEQGQRLLGKCRYFSAAHTKKQRFHFLPFCFQMVSPSAGRWCGSRVGDHSRDEATDSKVDSMVDTATKPVSQSPMCEQTKKNSRS